MSANDDSQLSEEMIKGVSDALLDCIRSDDTTAVVSFLKTLSQNVLDNLFSSHENTSEIWKKIPRRYLHVACEVGNIEVICLLLSYGADPRHRTEQDGTVLEVATKHGKLNVLQKLIDFDSKLIENEDSTVKDLLYIACSKGYQDLAEYWIDILTKLLKRTPCKDDFVPINNPLIAACRGGHYPLASYLVKKVLVAINREVAFLTGDMLNPLLELWCQDENDETEKLQGKHANWSRRSLYVFDEKWLTANTELQRNLVKINLSHNELQNIPQLILWGLPALQSLDLSHNKIAKLPSPNAFEMLTNSRLTYLKVSHNVLTYPVVELFMLPILEHLDLSHNHIKSLNHKRFPSELFKPEDGRVVWDCSNMKVFNLSSNAIMRIPEDISAAKSLEKLNVSKNKLTKLPAPWDCQLIDLNASHNQISEVPDMHCYWSQSLVNLDLSDNKLKDIPWTICQLTALNNLNLASNLITELPPANIWSIYRLKELCLADNRLFYVEEPPASPTSPSKTKKRSSNIPKHTRISSPSAAPDAATQGSIFYSTASAESTATMAFPEIFSNGLQSLDLSNNQLQHVPPSVCNLVSLKKLDLSGNASMTKLPDNLAQLKNLYSLKLDGMTIMEPESVAEVIQKRGPNRDVAKNILVKLNERCLDCKPYRGMKLMLIGPQRCGKTSLLYCLSNKRPDEDNGMNVATWALQKPVSNESSRLSFRPKFFSKSNQSDSGVNEIKFSTWDLKGSDMNSTIHQSFFTPKALYLLVWDLRDGTNGIKQLQPWLLNIQSRAPESIVIIVSTHLDSLRANKDRIEALHQEIRTKYICRDGFPDIAGMVEVAATGPTGEGINELSKLIYRKADEFQIRKKWQGCASSTINFIGRMVPQSFIVLQEIIANESNRRKRSIPPQPPVLKEDELVKQIKKIPYCKIEVQQDIDEAMEFLSTSGSLLHFSDHLQSLKSLYFLDPVWLYNILIKVTNISSSYVQEGRIHKNRLKELFEDTDFGKGNFEEYLQLLQRLELVLPISGKEFLIPSRLPREKPGQDFLQSHSQPSQTLMRLYKMPYTPPGFWIRLVSRVYVFLKDLQGNAQGTRTRVTRLQRNSRTSRSMRVGMRLTPTTIMYWQQGVSVQHSNGHIQLKPTTFQDNKPGIFIQLQSTQGEFTPMGFLVDQIEYLMKEWYPGLLGNDECGQPLVERLIPCPVCQQRNIRNKGRDSTIPETHVEETLHHFSVNELALSAIKKGVDKVRCPGHPEEDVALASLIPDLLLMDLPVRILDKKEFDFKPRQSLSLGSGGFGEVFRGKFRHQDVAVKLLTRHTFHHSKDSGLSSSEDQKSKKSSSGSDITDSDHQSSTPKLYDDLNIDVNAALAVESFSNLRKEVATMCKLKHPCIIQLIGISIQNLCFAMELAPLGDLSSLMQRETESQKKDLSGKVYRTILDRVLTYKIALQVARGVAYLHCKRIIYSDLKTDNVLLYSLRLDVPVNIKLTDYGIARPMDLQGARGQAGPTGFCAPEILRGRTFSQEVDWFSYSMVLYHLMAGVWPYDHLKSCIDIYNAVSVGEKPSFQFRDYSIISLFPNLERLMQKCWRDNPLERPDGIEIVEKMEDSGFECLKNVIPLDVEEITCLYSGCGERSGRVWFWTGDADKRQSTKIHIKYFTKEEVFPTAFKGPRANCMVQVGNWEIVGTKDNRIQFYCPPAIGPQQNVLQKEIHVDAEVLCLCYHSVKDKDIQGHLFAGLADGRIIVLKLSPEASSTSHHECDWSKAKVLTLEKKRCTHLMLVPERKEMWIACGNKLRVLNTEVTLLEKSTITVSSVAHRAILDLAYHGDNLFCITERSSQVLQYSMATCQLLQVLQCGNVVVKGDCLVSAANRTSDVEEDEEVVRGTDSVREEGTEILDEGSTSNDSNKEFNFRHSYFGKPQHATLPHPSKKISPPPRPFSVGDQHQAVGHAFPQVCSLLILKDTLWVGMSTGDIPVVCVDSENEHKYKFGELLAILRLFPEFGDDSGPVKQLSMAGDHVVAMQELPLTLTSLGLHHYQLLVWQAWGSEDIWKNERIHGMLNEAEEALGDA